MRKHNPHRITMHELVAQFVPLVRAIYPKARHKYLAELDARWRAGPPLPREDARVRHILRAIEVVEAEEVQRDPAPRSE